MPHDALMPVSKGNAGEIIDAWCCIVITTASGVYIIAQAVFYIEKIICSEKQINIHFRITLLLQPILPSTSVISTSLEAEHGINYEAGLKSSWLKQRLYVDVNAFHLRLINAIVQRRDDTGGDYFMNAGSTSQMGLESQASYQLLEHPGGFFSGAKVWMSHTWNHFHYDEFKQLGNDLSGKQQPGVAPHTVAAGIDMSTKPGWYAYLTYFYSDPIALNDANTAYASSYNLLGGRVGWSNKVMRK